MFIQMATRSLWLGLFLHAASQAPDPRTALAAPGLPEPSVRLSSCLPFLQFSHHFYFISFAPKIGEVNIYRKGRKTEIIGTEKAREKVLTPCKPTRLLLLSLGNRDTAAPFHSILVTMKEPGSF